MSKPALGFIGLGNMGGPMSTRLVKAGHEVFVYDRDEAALSRAVAAGCKRLESIQAVADQVEVIKINVGRGITSFQPVFGHTADRATGAVFKNYLWLFF